MPEILVLRSMSFRACLYYTDIAIAPRGFALVVSFFIAGEDDLCDVLHEVSSLKPDYFQLGIALGVPPSEVEAIKNSFYHNPEQALTEVLLKWLRGHLTASNVFPPTWQSLVKAVHSPICNNSLLAQAIASRHSTRSKCQVSTYKN